MATVVPDSRSVILRSTHILFIRIDSSEAGPWQPDSTGNRVRKVRLLVHLEQTLKGEVKQKAGSQLRLDVEQMGRTGTRYYALAGSWTDQPIEPGTRLVAFSSAQSEDASVLLVDPSCKQILPAEVSLVDVRISLEAEHNKLSLADALRLAEPSSDSLGYLFSEYVATRFHQSLLANPADFSALIRFMQTPKLKPVARTPLLDFAVSEFGDAPSPSSKLRLSLVMAFFNLLAMEEAAPLHDNLAGVYLPEVLQLNHVHGGIPAVRVFEGAANERARAEGIVNNYRGSADTSKLKDWLRR